MRTKEILRQLICKKIDGHRSEIKKIGDKIMISPELGFKEFKTAEIVSNMMEKFGLPHQTGLGITGVKGEIKAKKPGPTIALIGELDALVMENPQASDNKIKSIHACGHNAQIAGLLGAMIGLIEANAVEDLAGRIIFFAVPGEEYIEIEYRNRLVREGKIQLMGGKPELIRLGYFDDINIAMMIHTHSNPDFKRQRWPILPMASSQKKFDLSGGRHMRASHRVTGLMH